MAVQQLIMYDLTRKAIGDAPGVHCGFTATLIPLILDGTVTHSVVELMHPVNEKLLWTFRLSPYYPKEKKLDKYSHLNLFLDATLIMWPHLAHVSISIKEVLYLNPIGVETS